MNLSKPIAFEYNSIASGNFPFLYKLLAFLDHISLKETGIPSLRLKYNALERGPVPLEIYNEINSNKNYSCFIIEEIKTENFQGKFIVPTKDADLDYFNQYELNLMRKLIQIYAKEYVTSNDISEKSHESINSWIKAYSREKNSLMSYDDEFESLNSIPDQANVYLIFKELAGL